MTDNEIKKALDILDRFDLFGGQRAGRELWNEKPVDVQNEDIEKFVKDVVFLKDLINRLQAENERLKNAYKQCAWERDVFAKDTREELTKHITICEAEKTEIKAEAYKECLEKIEQRDVSESDFYIMVKKTEFDNLLKEKVGEDNA